jgi:flagellar biosynthetic protein FliR
VTEVDLVQLQQWVGALLWALGRVGGLVLVAPVFGNPMLPARIRVGITVMLTLVLSPLAPAAVDPLSAQGVATMVGQVLIGAAIGFVLRLVFEAVAFGGQLVAQSMSLGFSEVVNPEGGGSTPSLSQLYMVLVTLIFLAMNGHLQLVALLAESFRTMPPGQALGPDALHAIVMFGAHLFGGAVRVALPAVTSLLVVNIGFAAISRAAPSMNLFAVGFPITITLGMVVLWLSLPSLPGAFESLTNDAWSLMRDLVR